MIIHLNLNQYLSQHLILDCYSSQISELINRIENYMVKQE